jgi:hypothetical protein
MKRVLLLSSIVLVLSAPRADAEIFTWVDENGVTSFGSQPREQGGEAKKLEGPVTGLWDGAVVEAPAPEMPAPGRIAEERLGRLLRGAEQDLERGERARAEAVLTDVLRRTPDQPDAHFLLARLARSRGHYDEAEVHLEAFLASAPAGDTTRRALAERGLVELADERRLADPTLVRDVAWVPVDHPDFEVRVDAALDGISDAYSDKVLAFLEAAHREVGQRLGSVPSEPLGVMFYGRAAYAAAHAHRFSFRTVGFFDGRIHVVSAAHPAEELRALLFHEYTHAVFRERTGGDRPYWLNEGVAELAERAARDEPGLSRSERSWLQRRAASGHWIPLRRLAPSFAGLDDEDARAAYLEAAAAALWIEERTTSEDRARLLDLIGRGHTDDEALFAVLGIDTEELDHAVRDWIRSEFSPKRYEL